MEDKEEIKKQLRKKKKKLVDYKWIIEITLLAFIISLGFSFLSETTIPKVPLVVGIILLFIVILIGILFDVVGVAVQAADEAPFHSMNARKVKGASVAVKFKKNAEKVSSFCNDVIGDICGVISGTAGSIIALAIATQTGLNSFLAVLVVTACISALTIGGKAIGKGIAINKSNDILYRFSRIISVFYRK